MLLVDEVSWHWHTVLDLFSVQTINPHLLGLAKKKSLPEKRFPL